MKIRMIWTYRTDRGGWWGTCAKWAKEYSDRYGPTSIIKSRVMWVGKIPECTTCIQGLHH